MRALVFLALLASLPFLGGGCFLEFGPRHTSFEFYNTTSTEFCYVSGEGNVPFHCNPLKPNARTRWTPGCRKGADNNVVVFFPDTRRVIYSRTAPCLEWEKLDGIFIIKQVGNDFQVTDTLE